MVDFIPAVPAAPGPVNTEESFEQAPTIMIAAGTYRYGRNMGAVFHYGTGKLVNQETLYSESDTPGAIRLAPNGTISQVENSGLIVFRGTSTPAESIEIFKDVLTLTNSGRIFGVTPDGGVTLFQSYK